MPFTPPNRYWARPDWKALLRALGGQFGNFAAPKGSFQFDLVIYQSKRDVKMSPLKAWTQIKMSPENARRSLMTVPPQENILSGIIPPEIFSRVLARSRAEDIDPNDDASDAIVENPPNATVLEFRAMARQAPIAEAQPMGRKTSRATAKRKAAKSKSGRR